MATCFRYWLFIFKVIWLHALKAEHVNITTAAVTEASSARPTTLLKRLDVPTKNDKSTAVDIFATTLKFRRSQKNWWDWSFWCQEQPQTGNCSETLTKYYYDEQTSQCLTFTYTGCGGNKNQFDTRRDCELFCSGTSIVPSRLGKKPHCSLQPKAGRCLGYFTMYYYNVNERKCKTFVYGGCNGNSNRFKSYIECMEQCDETLQSDKNSGDDGIESEKNRDYT